MHRLSIAFACVVFASQPCWADHDLRFNLVRANTSFEQFRDDRNDCSLKTAQEVKGWSFTPAPSSGSTNEPLTGPPNNNGPSHFDRTSGYRANVPEFLRCMTAKGYQVRPREPSAARN